MSPFGIRGCAMCQLSKRRLVGKGNMVLMVLSAKSGWRRVT